jgi:hypothetical protein
LLLSGLGLLVVTFYSGRFPAYSAHELQVLSFRLMLFVAARGLLYFAWQHILRGLNLTGTCEQ